MWRVTSGSLHIAALSSKSEASGGLRVRRAVVRIGGIIEVLFGSARPAYTGLSCSPGSDHMTAPQDAIAARRKLTNKLIAGKDARRLAPFFAPDIKVIVGDGSLILGARDVLEAFASQFADPAFVAYVRTTDRIELDAAGDRAAEHGTWVGTSRRRKGRPTPAADLSGDTMRGSAEGPIWRPGACRPVGDRERTVRDAELRGWALGRGRTKHALRRKMTGN
jgi:ketosteroid isomerase-like protein